MKTLLVSALALGAMTSVALAAEPAKAPDAKKAPVQLTAAQMDSVTAGQLVDVDIERNDVVVAVPVNASANVCAVIAACASSAQQRPGRIQQ